MKRTPLRRVSKKRSKHRASSQGQAELDHLAAVKALPCVICGSAPSEAHHCISGRYGGRRRSDWWVIPLCASCHRTGPDAIHNGKASWEAKNGPDYCYLPRVYGILGVDIPEEIATFFHSREQAGL